MKRKKIGILINSLKQGGAEKVVYTMCKILHKRYEIHLILLENHIFFDVEKDINIILLNKSSHFKFWHIPIILFKFIHYLYSNDIKVVHSHLIKANIINIISKIFHRHKSYIFEHSMVSRFTNLKLFLLKLIYRFADKIITVSQIAKNDITKFLKLDKAIEVIYNPVNLKSIKSLSKNKICDFYFNENKKYIIYVGRLNKIKRLDVLINALNELSNSSIELLILGKEDDISYKDILKKTNGTYIVHYMGEKKNPFKYMRKCDIFVLPSESESFSYSIVEALACGLPVISSDSGGPREILAPDTDINKQLKEGDDIEIAKYGILFPVGDTKMLAKAIKLLLINRDLYYKYKQISIKRAEDFSIERIIDKYKKVLLDE